MKYRTMGSTGLMVSRLSLGTMTFGESENRGTSKPEALKIIKKYLDAGGNHLDTGDIYGTGRAEEIIGGFLGQISRDNLVIASKCSFPVGIEPNRYGASRKHIVSSCEHSLKRLRTDYVDLYYVRGPDPLAPWEETLRALRDLVRHGKVRYIGCSDVYGWHIAKAMGGISRRLWVAYREGYGWHIAKAMGWPLKQQFVCSVVLGVRTEEQLEADLGLADWGMPDDVWNELEERTRPDEDYLTWFNRMNYEKFFNAIEFKGPRYEWL